MRGLCSALVFVVVCQEVARLYGLFKCRHLVVVAVAQDGAVDFFHVFDHIFDDDACRIFLCIFDAVDERIAVGCAADAHTRAEVCRLDDYRVAQAAFNAFDKCVFLLVPLLVGKPNVVDNGYSAVFKNHFHRNFVHTVCRRHGVATGVGDTNCFENAFEDAVFAVCAVKHGDYYVDSRFNF